MMTDSLKARLELILMLSLPRDPGLTIFSESGNMKNLSPVANCVHQHANRVSGRGRGDEP